MKIFDMHLHCRRGKAEPETFIKQLEEAGLYGACVFSPRPKVEGRENRPNYPNDASFEERLETVLAWTKGYEGRLFPIMYMHPYEENAIENVKVAVDAGILGFKVICNDFFVYEEQSMAFLREIAKYDKPVFFHTGILWDGGVSSAYNRPINFEALIGIEGLRFSMGHCSWPWVDECIAMYGKFLHANGLRKPAEMYFDLTPGTPDIYRRELLEKMYTIGYDLANNVMFGTDMTVNTYKPAHTKEVLELDRSILLDLGVSKECFEKMYYNNLLRFLGLDKTETKKASPIVSEERPLTFENPEVKTVIKKWYDKIGFEKDFDDEFNKALDTIPVSDYMTIEFYNSECEDGKKNLLNMLFMCEELSKTYEKLGISEDILLDTLSDLSIWCNIWSGIKGSLYLGELPWLKWHMKAKLFKLGRLQYAFDKAPDDVPALGVKKGEPIIGVHIPASGPLNTEDCVKSLDMAREFFAKYFPEYEYRYFACDSWLLDESLKEVLPLDSNIVKFGDLFQKTAAAEANDIVRYVFGWDKKRYQLKELPATSLLAENAKKYMLAGKNFHRTLGYIAK